MTNIYPAVVYDLHLKVKSFLDKLDTDGQIDLDDRGYPYLLGIERQNGNFMVLIARNGRQESFIINPRKKADPIVSWGDDGFMRQGGKRVIQIATTDQEQPRRERQKRVGTEVIGNLVSQIMGD